MTFTLPPISQRVPVRDAFVKPQPEPPSRDRGIWKGSRMDGANKAGMEWRGGMARVAVRLPSAGVSVLFPNMAYEDELIISWVELHRDARYLSQLLHQRGAWKGVIAVTRGGMVPAALVARELDIRMVDTVCIASYAPDATGGAATQQGELQVLKQSIAGDGDGWLLIDDLVDTGRTAQVLRKLLPKAFFATLYAKPAGRSHVDLFVKEFKQSKWIHFPWDITYQFATPIKEGGRATSEQA